MMAKARLHIDVLGSLRVRRAGVPVTLASSRQRTVLVRLLVENGRPISAAALIDAGWGSGQLQRPAGALQTVLSRLRKTLAPEARIELTPAGYALRGVELDAARFDDLVAIAQATPDLAREIEILNQALGLWRGRAYEGYDLLAVTAEAERLEDARLNATERLAELLLTIGSAASAVSLLREVVRSHPYREGAHAALMVALYHAGRSSEALDHYHDLRELLIRDLGLDPSPALVELHRQVLTNDLEPIAEAGDAADLTSAGVAPPVRGLLAPSSSPLVGRHNDTDTFLSAVRGSRLVSLVGTGGVGKTRLAAELLPGLARELGLRLFAVGCERLADRDELRAAVAAAARLNPADPDLDRSLAGTLDRVPTLLLLDGSEGVRSAAAELATDLLANTESLRLVTTTRLPLECAHEHVVPIAPLPVDQGDDDADADIQVLFQAAAQRALPGVELSAADRRQVVEICRRLDGLPLAIELAGARAATIGLTAVRESLTGGFGGVERSGGDPRRSLLRIVEWTYAALHPDAALLLTRLAVTPGPVDLPLAAALSRPTPTYAVEEAFDQLIRASLLVHTDSSHQQPRYRILEFVRQFALTRLSTQEQRQAQDAVVGWAMDLVKEAIPGALGPGDRQVLDDVEVNVANLELALRLACQQRRTDAELLAGRLALISSHRLPFAVAPLILALGTGDDVPSPLAVAAAARAATLIGDYPTGRNLALRAWDAGTDDPEAGYLAVHTLSIVSLYAGDLAAAAEWANRILAPEHVPAARISDAHATLALAATYDDDLVAARDHAETAQAFATASGARAYRAFAAYVSGEVALREGNGPRARDALRQAVRVAVDAGAPFVVALSETALGSLLVRDKDPQAAAGLLHRALAYWHREGVWPQTWTTVRLIAELCLARGDDETALQLFESARVHPSAPDMTGSDAVRESDLVAVARSHLNEAALHRVDELARRLTPANIVEHASRETGFETGVTGVS